MRLAERRGMTTVYEPAEDSRLLAETALERIEDERVLEVGIGSGVVASRIASETDAEVVGCDINPEACVSANAAGIDVIRSNLTDPFAADSFDVVVFNPPYLPTPPEEEWDDPLEYALSGGEDGRRVIRPFLADVGRVLRPNGHVYLLVSTLTDIEAVVELAESAGLRAEEITGESFPFERLVVLDITFENT
ncbi:MAG: HemK2/MTQ2 family protein methyltransferase [Halobacteriota archaeon]|uniref:HemK2/MTQ2 family protein methyltransferase n=1 Tax=Natronomonas sp. TaxID=2184060 RepID=UPI003974B9F9